MPIIKARNKLANRCTGGNKKQGLVPSVGKSRAMRYQTLVRAGENDKNVYCMNQVGGVGRHTSKIGDSADCLPKKVFIREMVDIEREIANIKNIKLNRDNPDNKIHVIVLQDKYHKDMYAFVTNNSKFRFNSYSIDSHEYLLLGNSDKINFIDIKYTHIIKLPKSTNLDDLSFYFSSYMYEIGNNTFNDDAITDLTFVGVKKNAVLPKNPEEDIDPNNLDENVSVNINRQYFLNKYEISSVYDTINEISPQLDYIMANANESVIFRILGLKNGNVINEFSRENRVYAKYFTLETDPELDISSSEN